MRKLAILAVLALAACNENAGWNPNYTMNGTPYGEYQRAREVALMTNTEGPAIIPIQLPAKAPTAADIAGPGQTKAMVKTVGVPVAVTEVRVSPQARAAATGAYPGSTPVLVRFAHAERHNPGTAIYPRTGANSAKAQQACRGFATADSAQTAFLAAGGPVIDPKGMDPDGDGFVCGWDPRPLRQSAL